MKALTTLFVVGKFLTTVAMADDVDDVKAAVLEHFATLNAGNMANHIEQHHMPQLNRFTRGGLRWHFGSLEEQKNQIQTSINNGSKWNLGLTDVEVNVYGDTAVLSGYVVGNVLRGNGNRESVTDRFSVTMIKQGGQWKEAHQHFSPLRIPQTQ